MRFHCIIFLLKMWTSRFKFHIFISHTFFRTHTHKICMNWLPLRINIGPWKFIAVVIYDIAFIHYSFENSCLFFFAFLSDAFSHSAAMWYDASVFSCLHRMVNLCWLLKLAIRFFEMYFMCHSNPLIQRNFCVRVKRRWFVHPDGREKKLTQHTHKSRTKCNLTWPESTSYQTNNKSVSEKCRRFVTCFYGFSTQRRLQYFCWINKTMGNRSFFIFMRWNKRSIHKAGRFYAILLWQNYMIFDLLMSLNNEYADVACLA